MAFLGHLKLSKIDPADIDAYSAHTMKTLTPKTVRNHLALLRVMFKVAMRCASFT